MFGISARVGCRSSLGWKPREHLNHDASETGHCSREWGSSLFEVLIGMALAAVIVPLAAQGALSAMTWQSGLRLQQEANTAVTEMRARVQQSGYEQIVTSLNGTHLESEDPIADTLTPAQRDFDTTSLHWDTTPTSNPLFPFKEQLNHDSVSTQMTRYFLVECDPQLGCADRKLVHTILLIEEPDKRCDLHEWLPHLFQPEQEIVNAWCRVETTLQVNETRPLS